MARSFDERVKALRSALLDPSSSAAKALMFKALREQNGYLASLVADALEDPADAWVTLMVDAFARYLVDPVKRDPNCYGKVAIARALYRADIARDEVFGAGIRHVQMEPVLGGRVDTAAELRGICGMALAYQQHPRAMVELAQLLADPERAARIAAAQALGASGRPDVAEPLLRMRIATGEDDPEVIGACVGGLLEVAPEESLPYVQGLLAAADGDRADAAAVALGSSRVAGAFELLRDHLDAVLTAERRAVAMLAIALCRTAAAWDLLVGFVEDDPPPRATAALRALSTFRDDERLFARVQQAVQGRADRSLDRAWAELFEDRD